MKKLVALSVMTASLATGFSAQAAPHSAQINPTFSPQTGPQTQAKQGAVFTTTTLAGIALGGPVGMVIGAVSGAYLGDQVKQADEVEVMASNLKQANARIEQLQQQLSFAEQQQQHWQQLALEGLDNRVLFQTASDQLTAAGRQQVDELAQLLLQHPHLEVRLDGYADPRGTDEYNNVLSQYRAYSVRDQLLAAGVEAHRIDVYSHGSSRTTAKQGDLQAYVQERRVEMDVRASTGAGNVVMN